MISPRWWLLITPVYGAVIYCLSALPWDFQLRDFPYEDKVVHAVVFGFLGVMVFNLLQQLRASRFNYGWTVLLVAVYACTDEWHQAFVPNRYADVGDWAADVVGAVVSLALLHWWRFLPVRLLRWRLAS